ncbi:hypothetical protein AJ80_06780 [Polytolypa hystricis UAMH7299]|uniref:Transcription factor Rba50 n=1 Tax=Polytolypa hystricis (strain UAMH7299) TaxID=1447883 RepID=A0A2B7XST1_POLH7|nr:hypothetical protein AJ80_06780 [Polytolypa hystricis UAMH7299]
MTFRGERFMIDLSDDDEHPESGLPPMLDFVGDIRERDTSASATPPAPPRAPSSTTGFPEPRKRSRQSAFKRRRAGLESDTAPPRASERGNLNQDATATAREMDEKKVIDEENRRRLAAMSPAEIQSEKAELMSALPPSLLERFLRRANIDHDGQLEPTPQIERGGEREGRESEKEDTVKEAGKISAEAAKPTKSVSFDIPPVSEAQETQKQESDDEESVGEIDDRPPLQPPPDLFPASQPPTGSMHFPKPLRQDPMPNLDPSSPSFLSDLQSHYFPDTPQDPSSLSWMQPEADPSSAYDPESTATGVAPASLRFSLTGSLLAPNTSLSLPTSLGLHHHADDPEAAGYTIPELATLSRSTLPAQRCLAWQVLGRFLYRLGKGDFGERGSGLVEGLWSTVEREGVVAGMLAEAGGSGGGSANRDDKSAKSQGGGVPSGGVGRIGKHASATAWATDALWLWRQGGGGDRGLVKEGTVRSK